MSDWRAFTTALLGSWPAQVASWDREAIAAYVAELEARAVSPEDALRALRASGSPFPPSAGEVAASTVRDPGGPTFEECYRLIYGPGGVLDARPRERWFANEAAMLAARNAAAEQRACGLHPLVASFVSRLGAGYLRGLGLDDPDYGALTRRDLREAWDRHCEAMDRRGVAALVAGRREELARFDPLAVLGVDRQRAGAGSVGEDR
jgi:hypothetical protein